MNIQIFESDIQEIAKLENLTFDQVRTDILMNLAAADVQACPGSGKTTLIAAKLILLAKRWPFKHKGICVLSHTNVAKNEIIRRIDESLEPRAKSLLGYPHFIGTIQSFVNKHLAIPYLRSLGRDISVIDTNIAINRLYSSLSYETKSYLQNKHKTLSDFEEFKCDFSDGKLILNNPFFAKESKSASYSDLLSKKKRLLKDGFYYYSEMFSIAEYLNHKHDTTSIISSRYPITIIDEMQDTTLIQDNLLSNVFSKSIVQRFGDPDQAIFGGQNDTPNTSYNTKETHEIDHTITDSFRFGSPIADLCKTMSFNSVQLTSSVIEERSPHKNIVFIYNEGGIAEVIPTFLSEVENYKEENEVDIKKVKIVGAVGNELSGGNDLKIASYYNQYNEEKRCKNTEKISFIESLKHICEQDEGNSKDQYDAILDCIICGLRRIEVKDDREISFTRRTYKLFLKEQSKFQTFKHVIAEILLNKEIFQENSWNNFLPNLHSILPDSAHGHNYWDYNEIVFCNPEDAEEGSCQPSILDGYSFKPELSSIHGIKGETHDATLLLETKFHELDIKTVFNHFVASNTDTLRPPKGVRAPKFMKQAYVAMTRPKHMLCVAISDTKFKVPKKKDVTEYIEESIEKLTKKGWQVVRINPTA